MEFTSTLVPPRPSIEEQMNRLEWDSFYSGIKEKGEGLDKLIGFVGDQLENINNNMPLFDKILKNKFYGEIYNFYIAFMMENKVEEKKDMWNVTSNILRYLKMMKKDEPLDILPYKEKEFAEKFIDKLKEAYPHRKQIKTYLNPFEMFLK